MAAATDSLTPKHLPLESTGLTPGFGGTPGFFSAEFGTLNPFDNPFDVDFEGATVSPLRVATPPSHHSVYHPEIPRTIADTAMRRNYDPTLVPTPGPRLPAIQAFKSSALKESSSVDSIRLPPSPEHSPPVMNPALLDKTDLEYPPSYMLPPPIHTGYGSTRGIHGEVTPPTDGSRSPDDKESKPKPTKQQKSTTKKRKFEDIESRRETSKTDEPSLSASNRTSKKEEEVDTKRKKFLERNRLAASKCRQKKKEWANNLEEQARYQAQEYKLLRASVAQLRDECLYLKNFLLSTHTGCSCVGVKNYFMKEAQLSQQVAGMVGGVLPIASLVHHSSVDMGRAYPSIVVHPSQMENRTRSQSVGSVVTMSDGRGPRGSMSPPQ